MNNNKRNRSRKNDGTIVTTMVVVGAAVLAGAAVFYGVSGFLTPDTINEPLEPFTLEVPDYIPPTVDDDILEIEDEPNVEIIPQEDIVPEVEVTPTPEPTPDPIPTTPQTPTPIESTTVSTAENPIEDKVEIALFVLPVEGTITHEFSHDELVFNSTLSDYRVHSGVDFSADEGTKVRAISSGIISNVYVDDFLGTVVEIKHTDEIIARYCNLMEQVASGIEIGLDVEMGQTIGGVGQTSIIEVMQGPHLHFEVLENGEKIDPMTLFSD